MEKILSGVKRIAENCGTIGFEGIVLLDSKGEKLYEKRWVQDYPRDIYSNTKSITSIAVGMSVYQGLLELDTRVADIFSIKKSHVNWRKLRLRDLLTMRSGFIKPNLMYFDRRNGEGANDYLEYLFSQDIVNEPGTKFIYSTGDAVLAGCMVEEVTGMSLKEYLYKNLFIPMGISFPIWESDMIGHCCGGSGLHLKLEEMGKLACLYLNKGKWDEKIYFDEKWISNTFTEYTLLQGQVFDEGYGFFWRVGNHGQFYRASGVFGQETIIFPRERVVLACHCKEGTDDRRLKEIIKENVLNEL